ncbi:unnamed protein product, partial [Didymodactylos carnosus]
MDFLENSSTFVCIIVQYIRNISRLTSSWILVSFTIERLVVIYYPLHRKSICRRKTARYILLIIFIISIILNVNVPFHYGLLYPAAICDVLPKYRSIYMHFVIVTMISVYLIPMFIIGIGNMLIMHKITLRSMHKQLERNSIDSHVHARLSIPSDGSINPVQHNQHDGYDQLSLVILPFQNNDKKALTKQ